MRFQAFVFSQHLHVATRQFDHCTTVQVCIFDLLGNDME